MINNELQFESRKYYLVLLLISGAIIFFSTILFYYIFAYKYADHSAMQKKNDSFVYAVYTDSNDDISSMIISYNGDVLYRANVKEKRVVGSTAVAVRLSDTWNIVDFSSKGQISLDVDYVLQENSGYYITKTLVGMGSQKYEIFDKDGRLIWTVDNNVSSVNISEGLVIINYTEPGSLLPKIQCKEIGGSIAFDIPKEWKSVSSFLNGIAIVELWPHDSSGERLSESEISTLAYAGANTTNGYLLINKKGEELNRGLEPYLYGKNKYLCSENYYLMISKEKDNSKIESISPTIIDKRGRVIASNNQWIPAPSSGNEIGFSDNLCIATPLDGIDSPGIYFGYVDESGAWQIEPEYLELSVFSEGYAFVMNGEKNKVLINKKGEVIGDDLFFKETNYKFYSGRAFVEIENDGPAIIDNKGNVIVNNFLPLSEVYRETYDYDIQVPKTFYKFYSDRTLIKKIEGWQMLDIDGDIVWKDS